MNFTAQHLNESIEIIKQLDISKIDNIIEIISNLQKTHGRIFFLGVGGSAANCSHAVNDFRKILGIESYAPTDNVSELTARTNDDGWKSVFIDWLRVSRLKKEDLLFVLSVGGGNVENNISPNIVAALDYAKLIGTKIIGVIGKNGGYTATVADECVIIPNINDDKITPHAEAMQGIIWHLIVSHPSLNPSLTKWESLK